MNLPAPRASSLFERPAAPDITEIERLLAAYSLSFRPVSGPRPARLFQGAEEGLERCFASLWRKYAAELASLSASLAPMRRAMASRGHAAVFGDVEGELLYILVRETRPELVYEISPNSGYSTNYLLAALTRNGAGRLESFEIIERFGNVPTVDAIRANLIDGLDLARHHINIGDALLTAPERLARETPSFTLIDSCHEDWFARDYVRDILPRLEGLVFVQDIAHFDPRPEFATEAYFLLSYLEETATRFVCVGDYEDALIPERIGLTPRRPIRSNSILLALDPGAARDATWIPRYDAAWREDRLDAAEPGFIEAVAILEHRLAPSAPLLGRLTARIPATDPFQQVYALRVLAAHGRRGEAAKHFAAIDPDRIRGAQLPLDLATVAYRCGAHDAARFWLGRCRDGARDLSLATGYRQLLGAVEIYLGLDDRTEADAVFAEVMDLAERRKGEVRTKIGREVADFCARHPRYMGSALRAGAVDARTLGAALVRFLRRAGAYLRRRAVGRSRVRPNAMAQHLHR